MAGFVVIGSGAEAIFADEPWQWLAAITLGSVIGLGVLGRRDVRISFGSLIVFGSSLFLAFALGANWQLDACWFGVTILGFSVTRFSQLRVGIILLALSSFVCGFGRAMQSQTAEALGALMLVMVSGIVGILVGDQSRRQQQAFEEQRRNEREQLARDLHDVIAHCMSAIALQADASTLVALNDPAAAQLALQQIRDTAKAALADTRHFLATLHSNGITEASPPPDLRSLPMLARDDPLVISVDIKGAIEDLSVPISRALYRIAQESVTNAMRHAHGAHRIQIALRADSAFIDLDVIDDGRQGFFNEEGLGIRGMKERAALLGGTLVAGADPAGGWRVRARVPFHQEAR